MAEGGDVKKRCQVPGEGDTESEGEEDVMGGHSVPKKQGMQEKFSGWSIGPPKKNADPVFKMQPLEKEEWKKLTLEDLVLPRSLVVSKMCVLCLETRSMYSGQTVCNECDEHVQEREKWREQEREMLSRERASWKGSGAETIDLLCFAPPKNGDAGSVAAEPSTAESAPPVPPTPRSSPL